MFKRLFAWATSLHRLFLLSMKKDSLAAETQITRKFCRNQPLLSLALGVLFFGLPSGLRSDTVYAYQSSVYTSCFGTYQSSPCAGSLSIKFDTTLSGAQLANLAEADITSTVTSFTMTDGMGVNVNNTNATPGVQFVIDTDAAGNITQWSILAANNMVTGPDTGEQFGAESCNDLSDSGLASSGACKFIPVQNNVNLGDYTFFERGTEILDASGGRSVVPGTWSAPVATPEPCSLVLLGAGLLGLLRTKGKLPLK